MIILQTAATGAFDLPNHSRGSHDLADVINVTAFHSPHAPGHLTLSFCKAHRQPADAKLNGCLLTNL